MIEADVKWTDELDKLKNSLDSKDAKIAKLERDLWKKEKKMNQIKKDIEYEKYKYKEMKNELEGSIMEYEKELGINQPKYADIELDENMLSQEEFEKINAVADREKELAKVRCKLKKPEKRGFADDYVKTEEDLLCENLTREQMLEMLNDPFVSDEMKEAMLRNLLLQGENCVVEDEFGNQMLVDENGCPLLDKDGNPIMLSAKMLDKAGISM